MDHVIQMMAAKTMNERPDECASPISANLRAQLDVIDEMTPEQFSAFLDMLEASVSEEFRHMLEEGRDDLH